MGQKKLFSITKDNKKITVESFSATVADILEAAAIYAICCTGEDACIVDPEHGQELNKEIVLEMFNDIYDKELKKYHGKKN